VLFSVSAATVPNRPLVSLGRQDCAEAICSTFSQRAVATSFERATVWRLRFLVVLYCSLR
jgi:hypothetical protein